MNKKTAIAAAGVIAGAVAIGVLATGGPEQYSDVPSNYAEIAADGTVLRVIVASEAFIMSGAVGDPDTWVETSLDGSKRKNYAGKGYKYDNVRDAFIPPEPENFDAELDEKTGRWKKKAI